MPEARTETVLLVCSNEEDAADILARLYEEGHSVIGPAENARVALAMAALAAPTIAVIATPLRGRRTAAELAKELMGAWGIKSWILDPAHAGARTSDAAAWTASADRVARLRQCLNLNAPADVAA